MSRTLLVAALCLTFVGTLALDPKYKCLESCLRYASFKADSSECVVRCRLGTQSVSALKATNESYVAGLIPIADRGDMFFWLMHSRQDKTQDPLVLWLTGGPGCSSEIAIFHENGPFTLAADGSFVPNPFSWNNFGNVLFMDQPLGTGFSKSKGAIVTNENAVASDMYTFMQGFYKQFPEFKGRDVYITGESYAGHYIPAISAFFVKQNNDPKVEGIKIPVKGAAIGNGWVDPINQYPAYAEFAHENNLVSETAYKALKVAYSGCTKLIKSGLWPLALEACQMATTSILGLPFAPRFNVYDIRKKCDKPPLCYDMSDVDKYFESEDVKKELGVEGRSWKSCNMMVHTLMLGDWVKSFSQSVAELLANDVHVLVYSGDKDFICNWRGGEAWVNALEWEGKDEFVGASEKSWSAYDKAAGVARSARGLTFLRVFDAGHMVPMDQPAAAIDMLARFMRKNDF
eukprot:GILK01001563.1.p1 GENE.GILK01001563.1~~GILK01001563.1.p1  ORF type:complete len:459 (-),score=65.39 GILK01001563.1:173-1549(-)